MTQPLLGCSSGTSRQKCALSQKARSTARQPRKQGIEMTHDHASEHFPEGKAQSQAARHSAHDHEAHIHAGHNHAGHEHSHGHGHDHAGHSHAPTVTDQNEKLVLFGFLLTFGFMLAEAVGGVLSGSLALIADAGHMLTDAAALALAWAGFRFGRRQGDARRTFGYLRLEILAGFVNALALIFLIGWITFAAVERLFAPQPVHSGPMMVIAVLGLLVNAGVLALLMRGDRGHLNIRGAMVHVMGDLLGSVAAIAAAVVIYVTGWTPIDPILSVLLSLLILRSSWLLLKNALHILMEGVPDGIALADIRAHLCNHVPGLEDVAHIHVWSITSGKPAATMEIRLAPGADPARCVAATKRALATAFGIAHATVEIDWGRSEPECALAPAEAPAPA